MVLVELFDQYLCTNSDCNSNPNVQSDTNSDCNSNFNANTNTYSLFDFNFSFLNKFDRRRNNRSSDCNNYRLGVRNGNSNALWLI